MKQERLSSTREQAKQRRRGRITDAARRLLANGDASFSMRNLADTAGVSLGTPYNLFGSKQAVMFALLEEELGRFAQRLEDAGEDPLEACFLAVTLACGLYAEAPAFHRTLLFAAYSDGGRDYRSLFSGRGHQLWRDMVERAVAAEQLAADTAPDALAAMLEHLLFSCVLEWVREEIDLEELEARCSYGFALLLLGRARGEARERLEARQGRLQARLLRRWSASTGANVDASTGTR